jgi:hypothetical protein
MNPLQPTFGGYSDAFVAKINPTGSALVYSTYLGGSGGDSGAGIAVDSAGNAYVVGSTGSSNFPTTNPLQPTFGGGYVDAFVAKVNPTGSVLIYSTYLGGSGGDFGYGIAVDSAGSAYVTGSTQSPDFPTVNPLQPAFGGIWNAFVAKLDPAGSALVYSTYLGGNGWDIGYGIAVDSAGSAYVTGSTLSTDFPTMRPLQPTYGGGFGDAFVAKVNPTGSALIYSTYLGGSGGDSGAGIAVDSAGSAYVIGTTDSPTLPANMGYTGLGDGFVTELNPTGSALAYFAYLGGSGYSYGAGIAVDSGGNAYVTGYTSSANFPTTNPLQPTYGGNDDAFVAKVMFAPTTTVLISSVNPSVSGKPVIFTATVSSPSGGTPTGKVTFRNGTTALATKLLSRVPQALPRPHCHRVRAVSPRLMEATRTSPLAPQRQLISLCWRQPRLHFRLH